MCDECENCLRNCIMCHKNCCDECQDCDSFYIENDGNHGLVCYDCISNGDIPSEWSIGINDILQAIPLLVSKGLKLQTTFVDSERTKTIVIVAKITETKN